MRQDWIGGALLAVMAFSFGLCVPLLIPMTAFDLLLYGLAFAGGAFVFGLALLVLFAGLLWLLGSRQG